MGRDNFTNCMNRMMDEDKARLANTGSEPSPLTVADLLWVLKDCPPDTPVEYYNDEFDRYVPARTAMTTKRGTVEIT